MTRAIFLLLFTFVKCVMGDDLNDRHREGLKWPPNYYAKTEKIDPSSGILESAEIWFNSEKKEATNAFNDKSVIKNYSWSNKTRYSNVRIRKYVPMHNEQFESVHSICVERVSNQTVNFLPLVQGRDYKYEGKEQLGNRTVDVWKYEAKNLELEIVAEDTIYSYKRKEFDIPVRYESKNFINGQTWITVMTYYEFKLKVYKEPPKRDDQGTCGACWAHAATAAVEGALAKRIGRLVDLSRQAMIDCSWSLRSPPAIGCDGGRAEAAFRYMVKHGSPMEDEYPYLEQDGVCHIGNMTTYRILGYARPTPHNPLAVKVALHMYGPVVAAIYFNNKMRFYTSGIFSDPDCNNEGAVINHELVIVGYGVRGDEEYWIAKNSHGTSWGQAGYILMSAKDNNCLLLSEPTYPIV